MQWQGAKRPLSFDNDILSLYWEAPMHRRHERTHPRQIATYRKPWRRAAVNTDSDQEAAPVRGTPPRHGAGRSTSVNADAAVEFGRCRVLLRRRQLFADGAPVELGTRAFDLLLVLLEADGSLVSKEELLNRVWPGIVVSEENLKVQVSALRKALGADRDVIHTEFGRGYRFTGVLCTNNLTEAGQRPARPQQRSGGTFLTLNFRQSSRCSFHSS
jgi:DNA-binding winged helix-turn-helix (wHTH) protein